MAGWPVCMTCDVTVAVTLADSYPLASSSTAGAAAEVAADRKELKYQLLDHTHTFIPMAFETFGPINSKAADAFNICLDDISLH